MAYKFEGEGKGPDMKSGGRKAPIALIVGVVLAAVAVLFIVQNTNEVAFELFWVQVRWPLWLVIVISMALGAMLVPVIGYFLRRRKGKKATKK